jgi:predicted outer membrane protein
MRASAVAAVLAFVAACSSDRSGGLTAPNDAPLAATAVVPGILIGADSNPVSVARGASATVNVRVVRIAGFTGAVTLSVDTTGQARGVRATIANATVAAGDTAARVVTITADTTAVAGATPSNVRINASGAGVTTQTLLLGVVVTAGTTTPPAAGFTLAFAGAAPTTVVAGQSGTVRVIVRRTGGFTGPVTITADSAGRPAGVTLTQGATAGDTITLNVASTAATAAGSYTLTLRGAGTGVTAQTLSLPLTVQPAAGFTLGTPTQRPVVLAGLTNVVTVPVQRVGGAGGAITYTATSATGDVTVTAANTAADGQSTVVTITADADAPAGIYPVTLTGTGAGGTQATTLNVEVVRDNPSFGFRFVAPAARPTVVSGGTVVVQAALERIATLAPDAVISVTTASRGLTVVPVRPRQAEGPLELRVIVDPGALPGIYSFTVTGATVRGNIPPITIPVQVTAAPTVAPPVASDANILGAVSESNRGEIAAGTVALDRAANPEVRSFAQMMIAMHTAADTAARNLAASIGVTPALPDSTLPQLQNQEVAALQATPAGQTFDRVYMAQQIVAHRRTLATVDAAIPRAQRAELRTFLETSVRPVVAAHLQQAIDIQTRQGGPVP